MSPCIHESSAQTREKNSLHLRYPYPAQCRLFEGIPAGCKYACIIIHPSTLLLYIWHLASIPAEAIASAATCMPFRPVCMMCSCLIRRSHFRFLIDRRKRHAPVCRKRNASVCAYACRIRAPHSLLWDLLFCILRLQAKAAVHVSLFFHDQRDFLACCLQLTARFTKNTIRFHKNISARLS